MWLHSVLLLPNIYESYLVKHYCRTKSGNGRGLKSSPRSTGRVEEVQVLFLHLHPSHPEKLVCKKILNEKKTNQVFLFLYLCILMSYIFKKMNYARSRAKKLKY